MGTLSNVSLDKFRAFLKESGLTCVRTTGGHEVWSKSGMSRPVIIQTHVDPVPEFILKNDLRNMGKTRKDLEIFLVK